MLKRFCYHLKMYWLSFAERLPRLSGWMLVAIALTVAVGFFKPELLGVSLYKLSLAVSAGVVGYFLDVGLSPYARPSDYLFEDSRSGRKSVMPGMAMVFSTAMLRRGLIVMAVIIGVCLGA